MTDDPHTFTASDAGWYEYGAQGWRKLTDEEAAAGLGPDDGHLVSVDLRGSQIKIWSPGGHFGAWSLPSQIVPNGVWTEIRTDATDDLAAFVAARLDEDHQWASRAAESAPWEAVLTGDHESTRVEDSGGHTLAAHLDDSDAVHIALHDPARVLREVAAKRDTLAAYLAAAEFAKTDDTRWRAGQVFALKAVVMRDAEIWSGHPDYRKDWAPA